MKKTLGILILIFTFFMCNNVVYGETVYAEFFTGYPEYKKNYQHNGSVYLNGYPYWYNDYNLGGVYAHCLEAGEPFTSDKISWTKTNYTSNSGITAAYLYILNNSSEQVESLAVRMMYAYINKDYINSDKTNKCGAVKNDTGPVFKCVFAKASEYETMGKIEDNCPECFDKYENVTPNIATVYNEAVSIYNSASVGSGKLSFEIVKINADSIQIKSKYGNTIYVIEDAPTSVYIPIKGNLKSEEYYYTIDSKYYKNSNTLYIYIKGTISIYSHVYFQDMMVVNRGDYTKIKINDILQCNVSPELNPKNSNFNVTAYKNAGCLCKTYNTTKKYNQEDFNAISNHAYTNDYINKNNIKAIVKTSVEKLQEEYINQCPPPCKIETSCSGLDNTCGDNEVGTVSSRIVSSNNNYTLNQCLQNSNLEGKDLLYHSTKFPGVYCLEDIKVYMGKSKVLVSSAGGTFGIYPHITSKITCATKDGMISNSDIYDEYLKNFRNNTNITINEEEDSFSQTSPKFEKYTNILGDIDGDGIIDTTDARKILRFSEMLEDLSEDQKKTADIDGDGIITQTDAEIALRIASDLDKNVGGFPNKSKQSDTVYLFFYPNKLFTTPIIGKTYMINAIERNRVYNLGYTFALNYNLPLINGEIGKYNLDLTLGSKLNNKFNTTEDCKKECSGSFYFEKPELNGEYCPPEYRNPDGSLISYLERYNQNSIIYSMCDIRNSSNFNEVLCQEAIGCYSGGIDFWYRPITLNDVFPNTKNDFSIKPLSKYRVTGSNWATKKGRETQQEIEKDGEKIYKNNTSSTTKNKVYYKITLTPQNMKEIRDYNDDQEKYDEGYADFTLDCDDKGFACKSSFLTDLLDENYGDYNDNEFNLSNARNWTKYTDGTAWK